MQNLFCFFAGIFSIFLNMCDKNNLLNLSDYEYPENNDEYYYVPIIGTNDIHGAAFPIELSNQLTAEKYSYGGLSNLASFIKILRKEYKNSRVLWFDGGDKFQGGFESKISNGTIMTDYFNHMNLDLSSIGNHDFDFGKKFLEEKLSESKFTYLAANIFNHPDNQTEFLPNTKTSIIIQAGEVKIGVIGLSTIETVYKTNGDISNMKFEDYKNVVVENSKLLRQQGADAVVILSHVGLWCMEDQIYKMNLKIWEESTIQNPCQENGEMYKLLHSLEEGVVDAVIGGHNHNVVHHWINKVPVIQSLNGGYYFNILYLAFKKSTKSSESNEKKYSLAKNKIKIEGPVPICDKIFQNRKKCDYVIDYKSSGGLKNFYFHKNEVNSDESVEKLLEKWKNQTLPYKKVIGYSELYLKRDYTRENILGNFAADAMRDYTKSNVSILNTGSFRSEWFPGEILKESVYSMFPFSNNIVTFKMTGEEIKKMLSILQSGKEAFYATSGVKQYINVVDNKIFKVLDVVFYENEAEIKNEEIYSVSTNDFLISGGDDFRNVINWYTPRELNIAGEFNNAIINYLEKIKIIERKKFMPENESYRRIIVV
jgi:2',3'-cyclic-nucleotide 2'-phosphodiesterase (5'-nucleotidase family)